MNDATPGYFGRYLLVNLSTGQSESKPLSESVLRNYIGGVGLGTWILRAETIGQHVDPLCRRLPWYLPLVRWWEAH